MRFLIAAATLLALAPAALAQVTTNDQALDSLRPAPAPAAKPDSAESRQTTHHHPRHATRTPPAAPAKAVQKLPRIPPGPPPNPVIAPPPLVLPIHESPPPPPVPMRADAPGQATPLPNGTRITFAPSSSTLNPSTFNAIEAIAAQAKANPAMIVGVTAWAPGTVDDPSTPRRLSLDRALAARAVLIANGIVSERIRTVAKGMIDLGTTAPPDRADIIKILPPPEKK
jgi:outer membrane protein OmpA-like peptidoglycan-associated protein